MRIEGTSLSAATQKIETIKGQIQSVNGKIQIIEEDGRLSREEKKEKTKKLYEELEGRKLELGRAKSTRNNAVITEKSDCDENPPANLTVNEDGDISEVSENARRRADYYIR